ncbi:alpha/beta hydrolase [Mucilaginibacter robiniae]|uniref:Alpha/beta hydrolase n=1 Tax=Mucilaginibacter robiniae TaxID=2728022 RepID=A0A7L5DY77_9SPHI|nr:alpha/beta hydrolase [Mucilaginibacter robiniae]QJD94989.1 alpha/beta hydrolase [Mucilaginibacter robiniae]
MQLYRFLSIGILLSFALGQVARAQSTASITGKKDTSFTTYSAYQSARKNYPNIKLVQDSLPKSIKVAKNKTYALVGKHRLRLDAFYPKQKSEKGYPAVLIIHGGGWRSGDRTQHYPLAERLAAQGYVCFTAEYRLSTEAVYPAPVYDLKAAVRWIRANAKKYQVDTSKVATLGFSAGGQLAAFLGATNGVQQFEGAEGNPAYSSQVQAVVDIDGILAFVHPESGEGDDSKAISSATHYFGYSKKDNPELWESASSLKYASAKTPPTLFLNSSIDRMHAGRQDYVNLLSKYHTYTEVFTFPDTPHAFCLFEPWFTPTVQHVTDFLDKLFKDKKLLR